MYLCRGLICGRPVRGSLGVIFPSLARRAIKCHGSAVQEILRGAHSRRLHAWLSNATAPRCVPSIEGTDEKPENAARLPTGTVGRQGPLRLPLRRSGARAPPSPAPNAYVPGSANRCSVLVSGWLNAGGSRRTQGQPEPKDAPADRRNVPAAARRPATRRVGVPTAAPVNPARAL